MAINEITDAAEVYSIDAGAISGGTHYVGKHDDLTTMGSITISKVIIEIDHVNSAHVVKIEDANGRQWVESDEIFDTSTALETQVESDYSVAVDAVKDTPA